MEGYGEIAVRATELVRSGACASPREAWDQAAEDVMSHSKSSQEKSCPRGAFLGLCEEGFVIGVPAGKYTESIDNKGYAVCAAQMLAADGELADVGPVGLWERVLDGKAKVHNSQMDVVLALYRRGLLLRD